jgi:hypothetical protein
MISITKTAMLRLAAISSREASPRKRPEEHRQKRELVRAAGAVVDTHLSHKADHPLGDCYRHLPGKLKYLREYWRAGQDETGHRYVIAVPL